MRMAERQRVFGFACCAAAALLPCVLIIIGEVFMPQMTTSRLHNALVDDTLAEVDEWCTPDKWGQNVSITLTVFNLTNAKELQTVTPAPKPHFEAVDIEFTQMGKSFNCSLLDDGKKIKTHDWTKWVPANPDVYSWEFVQVNPAYLGTIGVLAPSEKMLQIGLSHNILGSVQKALSMFGRGALVSNSAVLALASGALNETVATPEDLGAAQFGTSIITSQQGFSSVAFLPAMQDQGVCTPIELGSFMNDIAFAPNSTLAGLLASKGFEFSSFSMSLAEAKAFLSRFSDAAGASVMSNAPNWEAVLLVLVKQYMVAAAANNATVAGTLAFQIEFAFGDTFGTLRAKNQSGAALSMCSSAGGDLCPVMALAYASYLTSYLPEKFFVGCQLLGCADSTCIRDDGTYPLNSGLFTRLSLREMLHDSNADRLFKVAPPEAVPPGVKLEYDGLLGKHAVMNASLDSLLAAESDMTKWSSVKLTGKSDITRVKEGVEYQGSTILQEGNTSYPGWGNDGIPGEPFEFTGQHYLNNQAPQTTRNSPIAMASHRHKSSPQFGTSIDFLLTPVKWPVSLGCGASGSSNAKECEFHTVKGIHTKKFAVPADLLKTKKAGVPIEACRGTVSQSFAKTYPGTIEAGPTCDFLQRHDGVINMAVASSGAPLAVTHGYLGQTSAAVRDAVSITRRNDSSEVYFEQSQDELALFVEPITGSVIRGYERLQTNWYVERSLIDGSWYGNIFSAQTDNDDVFVWPFMYIKKEPAITDSDAKEFVSRIYGAYDMFFHLDVFGILMAVVCVLSAAVCFHCNNGSKAGTQRARKDLSTESSVCSV